MSTWTPDEIREHDARFLSAAGVEQFDGGTERDKRDEYWLTFFYAAFILASAIGAAALLNAWLPMPEGF